MLYILHLNFEYSNSTNTHSFVKFLKKYKYVRRVGSIITFIRQHFGFCHSRFAPDFSELSLGS